MVRQNEIATDFWKQLFASMARAEDATLMDPQQQGEQHQSGADVTLPRSLMRLRPPARKATRPRMNSTGAIAAMLNDRT
jgi:hypothetical protein